MVIERVALRIEYRKGDLDKNNHNRVVEFKISPNSSSTYCDQDDFLTSADIVEAKVCSCQETSYYDVKIKFTEKAFHKLNELCAQKGIARLVLFIKGVPFYSLALRGPFKKPEIIMVGGCEKKEAELLVDNLNDTST